jgi:hypothetical protein
MAVASMTGTSSSSARSTVARVPLLPTRSFATSKHRHVVLPTDPHRDRPSADRTGYHDADGHLPVVGRVGRVGPTTTGVETHLTVDLDPLGVL